MVVGCFPAVEALNWWQTWNIFCILLILLNLTTTVKEMDFSQRCVWLIEQYLCVFLSSYCVDFLFEALDNITATHMNYK